MTVQPWHFGHFERRLSVLMVFPRRVVIVTFTAVRIAITLAAALWRCEMAKEVAEARRWWRGR